MSQVRENLFRVKESIKARADRSGRVGASVELIVVTKQVDVARIREVYDLGERNFGENRVQELLEKSKQLPEDVVWHLIGHLQSNKVKHVVGAARWIHSVDNLKLAQKLEDEGRERNIKIQALIQCNTSQEESKFGLSPDGVEDFLEQSAGFRFLNFKGFMTMAPQDGEERILRKTFSDLRAVFDNAKKRFPRFEWAHLSMGMSQDYEIAVEEGATMVRVGTAVFGARS